MITRFPSSFSSSTHSVDPFIITVRRVTLLKVNTNMTDYRCLSIRGKSLFQAVLGLFSCAKRLIVHKQTSRQTERRTIRWAEYRKAEWERDKNTVLKIGRNQAGCPAQTGKQITPLKTNQEVEIKVTFAECYIHLFEANKMESDTVWIQLLMDSWLTGWDVMHVF